MRRKPNHQPRDGSAGLEDSPLLSNSDHPPPHPGNAKPRAAFMGRPLFHSDLLTCHEPGRDAFHRVPVSSGQVRDAVECVPTLAKARFTGRHPSAG